MATVDDEPGAKSSEEASERRETVIPDSTSLGNPSPKVFSFSSISPMNGVTRSPAIATTRLLDSSGPPPFKLLLNGTAPSGANR